MTIVAHTFPLWENSKYLFYNIVPKFCHLFLQHKCILPKFYLSFSQCSKHFKIGLQKQDNNTAVSGCTKKKFCRKELMNKDNIFDFPTNIIKLYTQLPRTPSFLYKRRKIPLKISEEILCGRCRGGGKATFRKVILYKLNK